MSSLNSKQRPREILTSIIKSLSNIPANDSTLSKQTHATDQASSFNSFVSTLEEPQQGQVKYALLTLHFLFPHELLPALDLLDRKLITCLDATTRSSEVGFSSATVVHTHGTVDDHHQDRPPVMATPVSLRYYYVQSASAATHASSTSGTAGSTSRYRNAYSTAGTFYEVYLDAWNCSCPAFAFSSMKLLMSTGDESSTRVSSVQESAGSEHSGLSKLHPGHNQGEATMVNNSGCGAHAEDDSRDWQFGGSAINTDSVVPICKHILAVTLAHNVPSLFGSSIQSTETTREEIAGRAAGHGTR